MMGSLCYIFTVKVRTWNNFDNQSVWVSFSRSIGRTVQSNQIKSNMTLIMVDKPQPSYNLLNVMK